MQMRWDTRYDMSGRKRKKKKPTGEVFKKYKPKADFSGTVMPKPFRRDEGVTYKSVDDSGAVCGKKESMKYTGTLVTGISTMHKSNAVPVINQEQATEISQMRRN